MVEAQYGDETVYWFDEHFFGDFEIPEARARAQWYQIQEWPYVRVDGASYLLGIYSCEEAAQLLGELIDARLAETGGVSPVSITGSFRADGTLLEWRVTFRLIDPASLIDLRGTFVAIEDGVEGWGGELFPRVTRAIQYEPVVLANPGDSAQFVVTLPQDPTWNAEHMRTVVFLQQTSESKQIIQGTVLPNEIFSAVPRAVADRAARTRIGRVAPNPFTASTELVFHLSETAARGPLSLEILDPLGRRVRDLRVGSMPRAGGCVAVAWDGMSDSGVPVPGGSYFFQLTTPDGVCRARVIRIR
jgi:hypothetical protein